MGIADYFLITIVLLAILDIFFMVLYCFVQEKIERYTETKKKRISEMKTEQQSIEKDSVVKKLYHYLQSYAGGLTRYNLIVIGKIPSYHVRKFFYKYIFRMKLSKKTIIGGGCEIRSPWNIYIGNSTIMTGCVLDGRSKIIIGDNVVFGSFVHVWTAEHDLNDPYFRTLEHNKQPVIIDDRAWICSDSTLLPGVHIKEATVVAARACVTKDCEAFSVYGGVPAKKIGDRNKDLRYTISGRPFYRFY